MDYLLDNILKLVTIGSVLTGGIALYIAIRNNSRQVGAQIFLTYSDRIRTLRLELGADDYPRQGILDALYLIFEFFSLRRRGYVQLSIWSIWEADIKRLINTPPFRREWPSLRDRFSPHPAFIAWISEHQTPYHSESDELAISPQLKKDLDN
jgi:hypothetical protein